jgi:hypothetical protein
LLAVFASWARLKSCSARHPCSKIDSRKPTARSRRCPRTLSHAATPNPRPPSSLLTHAFTIQAERLTLRLRCRHVKWRDSPKKSDIYVAFLALLEAKRAVVLDHSKYRTQAAALERRIVGGNEIIDHPASTHDDVVNAVAGVLTYATRALRVQKIPRWCGSYKLAESGLRATRHGPHEITHWRAAQGPAGASKSLNLSYTNSPIGFCRGGGSLWVSRPNTRTEKTRPYGPQTRGWGFSPRTTPPPRKLRNGNSDWLTHRCSVEYRGGSH